MLCIDNEPAGLRGMQVLLEGWGCIVITARNAAEAIARLAREALSRRISSSPTTISTMAPAWRRWRPCGPRRGRRSPVIVITADHSAEVQREVRLRGYALLRKPLKAAALRALMYQLTWQRAVAAE